MTPPTEQQYERETTREVRLHLRDLRGIAAILDGLPPGELQRARHEMRRHADAIETALG